MADKERQWRLSAQVLMNNGGSLASAQTAYAQSHMPHTVHTVGFWVMSRHMLSRINP